MSIDSLITQNNKESMINLLKFITKGCNNICVSGQQGSGKTTMLLNLISFIYPVYPIRVSETCFELNLREKFPNRNICSLQETDEISGQKGLDLLKKTDGLINVIGEVASDEVATQLIQSGKVAARSTLFTHHAKTSEELIKSLRNSLLKTGVFKNEKVAEEEVASVIDFDVHLEKDFYGNRYIERVSECVYDNKTGNYEIVDLMNYDVKTNTYKCVGIISSSKIKKIQKELTLDDNKEFEKFIEGVKCQIQQ
ncbi:MAG: CpaF/VirB11 family protein [Clostridia bacterium]|nr:CpaF/VirB11 family protein [Clostridia bacterium]